MLDKLKAVGGFLAVVVILTTGLLLLSFGVDGLAWLSIRAIPWLVPFSIYALAAAVIVLLPLTAIRAARPFVGLAMFAVAYLFGLTAWLLGLLLTYSIWGGFWVIVGLVLLGVGVVPFGLLASLFDAQWIVFLVLLGLVVATYGFRAAGAFMVEAADE